MVTTLQTKTHGGLNSNTDRKKMQQQQQKQIYGELCRCVCKSISQHVAFFCSLLHCLLICFHVHSATTRMHSGLYLIRSVLCGYPKKKNTINTTTNNNNQFSFSVCHSSSCPMYNDRNVLLDVFVLTAFRAVACQYISF